VPAFSDDVDGLMSRSLYSTDAPVKPAFHDADTDTDTDILAMIEARMSACRSACHADFRKSRVSDVRM